MTRSPRRYCSPAADVHTPRNRMEPYRTTYFDIRLGRAVESVVVI